MGNKASHDKAAKQKEKDRAGRIRKADTPPDEPLPRGVSPTTRAAADFPAGGAPSRTRNGSATPASTEAGATPTGGKSKKVTFNEDIDVLLLSTCEVDRIHNTLDEPGVPVPVPVPIAPIGRGEALEQPPPPPADGGGRPPMAQPQLPGPVISRQQMMRLSNTYHPSKAHFPGHFPAARRASPPVPYGGSPPPRGSAFGAKPVGVHPGVPEGLAGQYNATRKPTPPRHTGIPDPRGFKYASMPNISPRGGAGLRHSFPSSATPSPVRDSPGGLSPPPGHGASAIAKGDVGGPLRMRQFSPQPGGSTSPLPGRRFSSPAMPASYVTQSDPAFPKAAYDAQRTGSRSPTPGTPAPTPTPTTQQAAKPRTREKRTSSVLNFARKFVDPTGVRPAKPRGNQASTVCTL